jgi:hypothetical protein
MFTVLLGNGMNMIWHEHSLSWHEPMASGIAFALGFMGETASAAVFYAAWWAHLLILLTRLCAAVKARPLNCRTGKRIFQPADKPGKASKNRF